MYSGTVNQSVELWEVLDMRDRAYYHMKKRDNATSELEAVKHGFKYAQHLKELHDLERRLLGVNNETTYV